MDMFSLSLSCITLSERMPGPLIIRTNMCGIDCLFPSSPPLPVLTAFFPSVTSWTSLSSVPPMSACLSNQGVVAGERERDRQLREAASERFR